MDFTEPAIVWTPALAIVQHETHHCVPPPTSHHMHRSNKVHSNIDRPIDFPTPIEEEEEKGRQHFLVFFFWPGWWRVGKSQKPPPKSWFFLFFLFFRRQLFLVGRSQPKWTPHTQLPALRVMQQQTSCPARNPPPSAKKKKHKNVCVRCLYILMWKLFSKKFRAGWWCDDGSVSTIRNIPCCLSYNESIYIYNPAAK